MLIERTKTAHDPTAVEITDSEAMAMARAALNLFSKWGLSDSEARALLGGVSSSTYNRWKTGSIGRISADLATRLSILMGIHKGLGYLFSDPARRYRWVKRSNKAFSGRTPLEVMTEGNSMFSLMRVRTYLDAERGGW